VKQQSNIQDDYLTHPSFAKAQDGVTHAFFTRKGGISEGVYASLNCGLGSNDRRENVLENRRRVLQILGMEERTLCTLSQIHSADVVTIDGLDDVDQHKDADALVTGSKDVVLGILTADCTPILFADANAGVVGAAHAGWKGTLLGVIENTVEAMILLGAKKQNISAVIGPTIAQESYEVSQPFYDDFVADDPSYQRFFIASHKEAHYQFDLPGLVTYRLEQLELQSIANICCNTYTSSGLFYSYRRTCHRRELDFGRLLSVITL